MVSLPKPDVILTHESDLDGLVSGLLLQRLAKVMFSAEVPLEAYNYQSWRARQPHERAAWVCDFSFEPRLDRPSWAIIDHHPTDATPKQAQFVHDLSKSASQLCYEFCREYQLNSPALDRLVHLSNVADLFLEEDPDFTVANDYANLVKTYQFWNLHALIGGELEKLIDHPLLEVMTVKRRVEDPLGLAWSRDHITQLSPTVGLVNTIIGNVNMIVHQLLDLPETPYKVLATLFRKGNGVIVVSLRSRNGEAAQVAEQLKGGGHPNAAGATLPRSVQRIADAIGYLQQILNPSIKEAPLNSLDNAFSGLDSKSS